jgi:DNA-binding Lrp family transcriptional regulator
MDETDKKLLNLIQENFPVKARPFLEIADRLGVDEKEIIERIRRLEGEGIIRRIGAVFDLKKLGFKSTLCAARVPEEAVQSFVAVVNDLPGVTHNYRRDNDYNIWFTLIAPDEEGLLATLERIKKQTGISDILSLSASRTFKINARFDV